MITRCIVSSARLPNTFDFGEFFILRKFRRKSVGKYVAHTLFDKHKGNWMIRQMISNIPAQDFWRTIVEEYTHSNFQETTEPVLHHTEPQVIQRFSSEAGNASKTV